MVALGKKLAEAAGESKQHTVNILGEVGKEVVAAWMVEHTMASLSSIGEALRQSHQESEATISWSMLSEFVEEDGSVSVTSKIGQALLALDVATELQALDVQAGMQTIVKAISPSAETDESFSRLNQAAIQLPVFVKIAQCEEARRNLEQVTTSEEKEKKLNLEMKVLQAYQDMSKQMTGPQMQCGDNTLMKKALLYKTSSAESVVAITAGVAKEMQEDISKMEGLIIDVSGICAKLPDSMDQLIDFPGREDLMGAIKRLQGGTGRGFKLFDRALPALRCADIEKIDGLPPMADFRKKAADMRQNGVSANRGAFRGGHL